MVSVFGVTGMLFDSLLSMFLSEGTMIFIALLLIVSIVAFIKFKGRSGLRVCCVLVGLFCAVYLCGVLTLAYLFGANHGPAVPTPQNVLYENENIVYVEHV